ncbi:5-methyltetrahydropteroyltriglutamate--homocysteine methyltransferase [Oceanobacillus oncorhynchi subsp. incaldanensis]|uniref:5-methyltetrahydropteroyltriglutamate--homocysteine methyltransferase n=2 Tax=Oceanobacillus TaxID=182709 RepID=A0A0A1MU84_9BACI|nr:5-methyltetrahydropteroyltriglutamate--homocysteine S-methyltransferase [Oceanobacillus oncorhynchi]MDM8102299.1 5-methyltetrahydropteroyltriglutamate--homocysteine S-methyltransferase [Oceanobacillus oncorhynchi]UUI41569.1 5-methyltetrahydropteroyltriglutamate--homocysteine S-methyltransferase [Oceanobacillus oncorhynchi]GIO17710.1 5-methyltetrahydropteroyltriglutamate--homocysteine methyltransferase [Oceanobacillus oncorhynchi subsp. incaldanensis]CEI83092.1 5-methyltetrahydropteroyltriglu
MLNIKYDIVGSFLRPDEIKIARAKYFNGEIDLNALREAEDQAISDLVEKEVAHGLKFVTDGEFRRRWWHLDWLKEFDGFTTKHFDKVINDVTNKIELGCIEGKISYNKNKNHPEIEAWDYLHSLAKNYDGVEAKKSISGPNMILVDHFLQLGIKDTPYYGTDIDLVIEDIGKAYQEAVQDLYDHGCRYLQIDDTSWTYMIDDTFNEKVSALGYTKEEVLEWFRRASAKALEKKPEDMTIATHFCKGNFKGNPLFSGFYDSVAEVISTIPYDGFFVEYDDARSGSFAPWEVLKNTGATFVVGLISTKNPALEAHDDIKKRYLEAKSVVGDNIALSPQCGFASVEEGNSIDEEIQWKKIDLLVSCQDFL